MASISEQKTAPDQTEVLVNLVGSYDEGVSSTVLADTLGWDSVEVRTTLLALEELGLVTRTGKTRATRWHLG